MEEFNDLIVFMSPEKWRYIQNRRPDDKKYDTTYDCRKPSDVTTEVVSGASDFSDIPRHQLWKLSDEYDTWFEAFGIQTIRDKETECLERRFKHGKVRRIPRAEWLEK